VTPFVPAKSGAETPNLRLNPPVAAIMPVQIPNCYEITGGESWNNDKWLPERDSNFG
jgi:hypothetical protein